MQNPASIPVKQLLYCHKDFDPERIQTALDVYHGGRGFEARKEKYLRVRTIEELGGRAGLVQRKNRLRAATYNPVVAGVYDWIKSAVFQAEPAILVSGGTAETQAYYNGLNTNIDGRGTDLPAYAREVMDDIALAGTGYMSTNFPKTTGQPYADLASQKQAGALDAKMGRIDPMSVERWLYGDDGVLQWIRTHTVEMLEPDMFTIPVDELHTWTFISRTQILEYEAVKEIGKEWDKDKAEARLVKVVPIAGPHTILMPFDAVQVSGGFCLFDRLSPLAIKLFNREAALDYSLDQSAFCMLVLYTLLELSEVFKSESAALKLQPGDKAEFIGPNPQHFASLQSQCDRNIQEIYSSVQASALSTASKASGPRQAAEAKVMDFGAISTFISVFGIALRDKIQARLDYAKAARGDDVTLSVLGLDQYDLDAPQTKLEIAERMLSLPMAESAKRYMLGAAADFLCANASPEVREAIRQETKTMELEPKEPAGASGPSEASLPAKEI